MQEARRRSPSHNPLRSSARGAGFAAVPDTGRRCAKRPRLGLAARFEVADALDLGLTVETVIDSGVFHVFGDDDRPRCVASLARLC